jgi:RHS repeat-associated protein
MTKGGARYYLACDQAGTLRVVTDSTGAVVKRIDYDTFGNVVGDTNPAFAVPFGFAGGLHDRDTGLVRFGYRDYDPETGRWTAKDPILFAGGDVDLYGYCLGDPVNFNDPLGLLVFGLHAGGSGGIGGTLEGSGALLVDHTLDVAVAADISGGLGPMLTADPSAGIVIAPFAKTSDLAGDSKRVNTGFGFFGVTIAIPNNPWKTAVSIDFMPGLDFGISYGAGKTWLFGADQNFPCE